MERRKFTREFKLEAVKLIKERGVAIRAGVARIWVFTRQCCAIGSRILRSIRSRPFPAMGSMKPEAGRDRAAEARSDEAQSRTGHPKKSRGLLREGEHVKFAFIAKHRGIWPAEWLCGALGVSRGGFYAWLTRPRSRAQPQRRRAGSEGAGELPCQRPDLRRQARVA